jgi:glutathione S-transferase
VLDISGEDAISTSEFAPVEAPFATQPVDATEDAPVLQKPKRRVGWIVSVALLSLALVSTLAVLALSFFRLEEARSRIEQQQELLEQKEDRIQEQDELIEKKETFSAAMQALVATAGKFDGALFGTLVPHDSFESLATRGWAGRWNAGTLDRATADAREADEKLADVLAAARKEAGANSSGTTYEAVLDRLGRGFVTSSVDDADKLCKRDVLGCVFPHDPFTVHFDAADASLPHMTDWLETGVAYHEFAHVLQLTNPEATHKAVKAFGGDDETMADCFALTYLDGWALDHQIWTSDVEYWDVSIGYGHTCDDTQRKTVRDWYEELGYESRPISQ